MLVGRTSRVSRARLCSNNSIIAPSLLRASFYFRQDSFVHLLEASFLSTSTMFRRAVNAHVSSEKASASLEERWLPSSSPSAPTDSQPARAQQPGSSVSLSNALRPTPGSKLNTANQKPFQPHLPVKRTASGLAKALADQNNDGFQDQAAMSSKASNSTATKGTTAQKQDSVILFDDDFDSDIELEVENPAVKPTVSYPSLPISYPKLPHKAQFHTHASLNGSQEHLTQQAASQAPPPSTQPLPWSSSPDFHKQPPPKNSVPTAQLNYPDDEPTDKSISVADSNTRPSKARVLPWKRNEGGAGKRNSENDDEHFVDTKSTAAQTPLSKSASSFPWNSTASAIKEQQKQLRKATKKPKEEPPADNDLVRVNARKAKGVGVPHLSKEQRHVLDIVVEKGQSVFFTGSAGTGKSVLLREIISVLRKKYSKEMDRVAVTASTGLAACNIGGVTLHSFAGIGLGKESAEELVKKIKKNQKARHRWMRTKILIIDEVSMVDGELFDKLETIARRMRNNPRPFGGIQLVITGDFFQLPPVPDYSNRVATFAFDAKEWNQTIHHTIGLNHVFRQKDAVFANMLNEMREGHLSQDSIATFRSLSRPLASRVGDEREATELFPTRAEVEAANNARMRQLSGATMVYEAKDGGAIYDKEQRDKLLANCMAPQELILKKGAQVMLIKNIDENLVNGSLGKVHSFMTEDMFNAYDGNPGLFSSSASTGPEEDNDLTGPQRMKDQLKLDALKASTGQLWPMVRFMNTDGTTRDLLCTRESWKVELPNGEVQASRAQIPLILAWALSIHKAQGQTLEKVKVDLGKVFEKGQAYVALSRATSIDGLQVLRFDPAKVKAHERVRSFYSSLSGTDGEGEM